jgi:hypothetical protein
VTQKSWDLTAGRGMSPIHILENGCKRLDASLDDVECCVWRGLHTHGTIGRLGVQLFNSLSICRNELSTTFNHYL